MVSSAAELARFDLARDERVRSRTTTQQFAGWLTSILPIRRGVNVAPVSQTPIANAAITGAESEQHLACHALLALGVCWHT